MVIELQTKISKVTIFRDGARVTRIGKTHLGIGPQRVIINKITDFALSDSFRVKGRGPAKLSSIDVQQASEVFEPSHDMKPLHEELKGLQKEHAECQDEIEFHKTRLVNLENMAAEFSNHFGLVYAANEGEINTLTEMDKKFSKMMLDTKKKIRELEDKLQEINKRIEVLRANIGRINSERRTETTHSLEVTLEVSEESDIELEITYQIQNAQWHPIYDVDLHPGKSILRRMALLFNRTKEDWKNVNLVVSTATARPVEAVEPTPYYVDVYDPAAERERIDARRMKKERSMPAAAPMAAKAMAPPAPPPEIEEEYAESTETVSGIAIYELPKPVTIPSDNEKHPITLIEEDLCSETIHYWYAEGMAEVVAQDKVTNGDNVILPGKVKVYAEGDYIGETSLPQISPREPFKIGTRIAHDIKAEKKLILRQMEKVGVMRGKLSRAYKYRLEIQSFSKNTIEIDIFDRIPHSLNPSIEVKGSWEKTAVKEENLGVVEWHKAVQPNQKTIIEYEYEIAWEKGVSVHLPLP